ncbi:flagellin [Kineococcus rhizosphaerae]|uniref:Flagellin n=1 Tax=Kineococcus rhizosphaerae TaxID=559628 RepID=A0A2T0RAR7_9ACTN|nr:flagellin [Kineococcus rhizosphaerae]PRY18247.1 flagellin [Kineococcus rhizosphaerae]
MGLRIQNNVAALNSYNNVNRTDKAVSSSLEKLSSGYRINKAADDAAGLVVSEGLRSQIGGLTVAARNAQDGVNVAQTADGALSTVTDILQRMRDLAVQASSDGSQDSEAQAAANKEFSALKSEIDRIGSSTKFGSKALLDGTYTGTFQVGANNATDNRISVHIFNVASLSASLTTSLTNTSDAQTAIDDIDKVLKQVTGARADLGAVQNRFEHAINNINTSIENITASESAIRDTDMAKEMTKFTKNQILSQAGTSMLAQANSSSQNILSLLRG